MAYFGGRFVWGPEISVTKGSTKAACGDGVAEFVELVELLVDVVVVVVDVDVPKSQDQIKGINPVGWVVSVTVVVVVCFGSFFFKKSIKRVEFPSISGSASLTAFCLPWTMFSKAVSKAFLNIFPGIRTNSGFGGSINSSSRKKLSIVHRSVCLSYLIGLACFPFWVKAGNLNLR